MKPCLIEEKCFVQNMDVIANKSLKPAVNHASNFQSPVALSPVPFLHDKHENANLL